MEKKLLTILETAVIPKIIEQIIVEDKVSEFDALTNFYSSKTYEVLLDEETSVWHFSPLTIYYMYKSEMENGKIIFPVEG